MDDYWRNREVVDKQFRDSMEREFMLFSISGKYERDHEKIEYDFGSRVYVVNGEPINAILTSRDDENKLLTYMTYKSGVVEGFAVLWHSNGQIKSYAEMAGDVYHGEVIEWDKRGNVIEQAQYFEGQLIQK